MTLIILSFVSLVLPLSLILIKTKTNLFPKATTPATPPVTSPTPYPSYSPLPSAIPNIPISLDGEMLPNDPRISYHELPVAYSPLSTPQNIDTVYLDNSQLPIESGYGIIYTFRPAVGTKIETLAREVDINTQGSYVKTALYDPDGKKINQADTRHQFTATTSRSYYLVVYTFDHKEGAVATTITQRARKDLFYYIKRIDRDLEDLYDNYSQYQGRIGRKAAEFFLQVPEISNVQTPLIDYRYQNDMSIINSTSVNMTVPRYCSGGQTGSDVPLRIERLNPVQIEQLNINRALIMKVYPRDTFYFAPGYDYVVNLEYPDPSIGSGARFSTISQSGQVADLNNDAAVDISDYSLLVSEFMHTEQTNPDTYLIADLNCDGLVDISDYSLLVSNISL